MHTKNLTHKCRRLLMKLNTYTIRRNLSTLVELHSVLFEMTFFIKGCVRKGLLYYVPQWKRRPSLCNTRNFLLSMPSGSTSSMRSVQKKAHTHSITFSRLHPLLHKNGAEKLAHTHQRPARSRNRNSCMRFSRVASVLTQAVWRSFSSFTSMRLTTMWR